MVGATPVQAFAAGAALCSTSLGTTFTVLASSGLSSTRLGVVLTSAAMMDDVVGLVMVRVISNLGDGTIDGITVVRPVLVPLAFATTLPLACRFVLKPGIVFLNRYREAQPSAFLSKMLLLTQTAIASQMLLLVGLVAPFRPHAHNPRDAGAEVWITAEDEPRQSRASSNPVIEGSTSSSAIYERFYHEPVQRVLQPYLFASIGFSIPISRMFTGSIVWRGVVCATLMAFGKLVCGLYLVRMSHSPTWESLRKATPVIRPSFIPHFWGKKQRAPETSHIQMRRQDPPRRQSEQTPPADARSTTPPKPVSLQPPLILALAMVARGEIGFLISAVAEANGVFSSPRQSGSESELFLVVTWAIVLCTLIWSLGVGLCVRRVKDRRQDGSGRDVLGVWGVRLK
ncbi:hypothetical protein EJ04DRAFT_550907 [Polyplosphaeria fusca]|uniref:Cation/H+ exchanger transmembrane domain-containing protein n=1 Tax=Polyplosphaeria fusca TaxID=682080 RepID=A0A9P4R4X5_9PLEO|nr:hypothetical protein EJ04DRAFT_550907 [Polyplosphaeria fusca]